MMRKKKLVPKNRFKGHFDNWKEYKLEDLSEISTGKAFKSADFKRNGEYLVVTNKNIQDQMNKIESKGDRINISDDSVLRNYLLTGENILVTMDGVNIGKVGKYSNNKGVLAQRVGRVKSDQNEFIYQITSKNKFLTEMNKLSVGNAIKHISLKQIAEYTFLAPENDSEQQKIGQFFKHLDDMIALQQKKIDKTKALKSAYLAEMLPAEGERVPKRRFAGFTNDWEEKTLGDLGSVAMNKRVFKEQTTGIGEVPFYKIGTFGGKPDAFISYELFKEYKSKYHYPDIGDILISASGSIGRTVEYKGKDEYFQDSNIVWLKHDGRLDNTFLKQFYLIVKWQGLEGSTITRLYNSNILNTKISVPSLAEQQKIGEFFTKLDNIITTHQQKLEKLKATKQAYLNEMFV